MSNCRPIQAHQRSQRASTSLTIKRNIQFNQKKSSQQQQQQYSDTITMDQRELENAQFEIPGREVPVLGIGDDRPGQGLFQVERYSCRQDLFQNTHKNFSDPFTSLYNPATSTRKRAPSGTSQAKTNRPKLSSKMRLMVFIKIILKCLETDDPDPSVRLNAKRVIAECTKKNREGHPDYTPLEEAIERRLRFAVDDCHWNRAQTLMDHYIMMHSLKQPSGKPFKNKQPNFAQV
jgi:hypothetical protein